MIDMAYDDGYGYGYMGEGEKPSKVLLGLTALPIVLDTLIFILTDGFNAHPHYPHFIYMIVTIALAVIAVVAAIFAYMLARDEEPEWGDVLPFKIVEGVNIASLAIAILFTILIVYMYYLYPAT